MDGESLAYYRKKAHMTQETAATAIGIRRETLSLYELNKKIPRTDTVKALADLYGCEIADLICEIPHCKTASSETPQLIVNCQDGLKIYRCPECGYVIPFGACPNYCSNCGVKFDWSEDE